MTGYQIFLTLPESHPLKTWLLIIFVPAIALVGIFLIKARITKSKSWWPTAFAVLLLAVELLYIEITPRLFTDRFPSSAAMDEPAYDYEPLSPSTRKPRN